MYRCRRAARTHGKECLPHALCACVQVGHTALANAHGKIEERLARWLLMAHDRLENDELHLTHEFLSIMWGVRRAGVTTALHQLERSGLVSTKRSCVTVLDRRRLEKAAHGLYGVPEAEFERLFCGSPQFAKTLPRSARVPLMDT